MYRVLLRNNETREEVWFYYESKWCDLDYFMWTKGNYACDCNRHLFFEREKGRPASALYTDCGNKRYTAVCALLEDGTRVVIDEPKTAFI